MTAPEVNVHIGQVRTAKAPQILKALLGSCIGIALIWKEKKACALSHSLLPRSPQTSYEISGRYVDSAIASMIALLKIKPDDLAFIEAVVAGGGNMTQAENDTKTFVGEDNAATAMSELKRRGIKVIHQDTGGTLGRRIIIDSTDFSYRVEKIPRIIGA